MTFKNTLIQGDKIPTIISSNIIFPNEKSLENEGFLNMATNEPKIELRLILEGVQDTGDFVKKFAEAFNSILQAEYVRRAEQKAQKQSDTVIEPTRRPGNSAS